MISSSTKTKRVDGAGDRFTALAITPSSHGSKSNSISRCSWANRTEHGSTRTPRARHGPLNPCWALLRPTIGFGQGDTITADSPVFKHFAKYRDRVYAIGYNWLRSNADSAKQVIDGSDYFDPKTKKTTRLMGIKEICAENHSGKAIILTHSMGGLVARMAIAMHGGADLMHEVFHNVQPATGAHTCLFDCIFRGTNDDKSFAF